MVFLPAIATGENKHFIIQSILVKSILGLDALRPLHSISTLKCNGVELYLE